MANWKYTLKKGAELRKLIENDETEENDCAILKMIQECYDEILESKIFQDDADIYDIENAKYLIDGEDELVHMYFARDPEWMEYMYDSAVELINDRLTEFYDICDKFDIWVEI